MLIPRISRGSPDKVFAIVRNFSATALLHGDVVRWAVSADTLTGYTRVPGVDVLGNDAAGATTVAGAIHVVSVPTGATVPQINTAEFGSCQIWGVHAAVKTTAVALATSTVVQGNTSAAAVAADAGAASDITKRRFGVCITTGASNKAGIMIRAM